jgi:hypothetical protein
MKNNMGVCMFLFVVATVLLSGCICGDSNSDNTQKNLDSKLNDKAEATRDDFYESPVHVTPTTTKITPVVVTTITIDADIEKMCSSDTYEEVKNCQLSGRPDDPRVHACIEKAYKDQEKCLQTGKWPAW